MHPVKTWIGCGIHPVWSESLLSAWRNTGFSATHWMHCEDSDQMGQKPRLIWVSTGCTGHFVGFVMRWLNCKWLRAKVRVAVQLTTDPVTRSDAHLSGMQTVAGSILGSANILSWRLVMKPFLWPFSSYHWFKLGSCQLLTKGCALSSG